LRVVDQHQLPYFHLSDERKLSPISFNIVFLLPGLRIVNQESERVFSRFTKEVTESGEKPKRERKGEESRK
jgi:hypothetical protein